jgi:hypothetical protein
MKVDYAPRAIADLMQIGERSRRVFSDAVAAALENYIRATVACAARNAGERATSWDRTCVNDLLKK